MSTRSTTNNSRAGEGSTTAKCNYTAIQYGNDHGSISFGKVHKKGDVTSSVMLQGKDGRHRFYMDHDGQRPGYTTLTSPGTFAVKCGMDLDAEQDGIFLNAENGEIKKRFLISSVSNFFASVGLVAKYIFFVCI